MTRKVFQLSIELDIHAIIELKNCKQNLVEVLRKLIYLLRYVKLESRPEIKPEKITCPGVWLCANNGKVSLCLYMFDTWSETSLFNPIFPILIHERFKFTKDINNARSLADIQNALNDEFLYCELVQWSELAAEKGIILSNFNTCLSNLLYPTDCNNKLISGVDIELLMEPSLTFPGIIAPKIEIGTKTTIKEIISRCKKKCPTYVINPKVIRSTLCGRQEKFKRQRGVCHSDRSRKVTRDVLPKRVNDFNSLTKRRLNTQDSSCQYSKEEKQRHDDINNNNVAKSTCDYYKKPGSSSIIQCKNSKAPKCLCDIPQRRHCPICDKYHQYFDEITKMPPVKEENLSIDTYSRISPSSQSPPSERYHYHARLLHERVNNALSLSKPFLSKSIDNLRNNQNYKYDPNDYTAEKYNCERAVRRIPIYSLKYSGNAPLNKCEQTSPPCVCYNPRSRLSSAFDNKRSDFNEIERPKSEENFSKKECYTGKTIAPNLKSKFQNSKTKKYNMYYTGSTLTGMDLRKSKVRSKYSLEMYKPKLTRNLYPRSRIPNDKSNTNFRLNNLAVKPSIKISKKNVNIRKPTNLDNYLRKKQIWQRTSIQKGGNKLTSVPNQVYTFGLKTIPKIVKKLNPNSYVNKNVPLKINMSKTNPVDHLIIVERQSILKLIEQKLKTGEFRFCNNVNKFFEPIKKKNDTTSSSSSPEKNTVDKVSINDNNFSPKTKLKSSSSQKLYKENTFYDGSDQRQSNHPFQRIVVNAAKILPMNPKQVEDEGNLEVCDDNTCTVRTSIDSMIENLKNLILEKEKELSKESSEIKIPESRGDMSESGRESMGQALDNLLGFFAENKSDSTEYEENLMTVQNLNSGSIDEYIKQSSIASMVQNISEMLRDKFCNKAKCLCETYRNEKYNISDTSYEGKVDSSKLFSRDDIRTKRAKLFSAEESSYPSKLTTTDETDEKKLSEETNSDFTKILVDNTLVKKNSKDLTDVVSEVITGENLKSVDPNDLLKKTDDKYEVTRVKNIQNDIKYKDDANTGGNICAKNQREATKGSIQTQTRGDRYAKATKVNESRITKNPCDCICPGEQGETIKVSIQSQTEGDPYVKDRRKFIQNRISKEPGGDIYADERSRIIKDRLQDQTIGDSHVKDKRNIIRNRLSRKPSGDIHVDERSGFIKVCIQSPIKGDTYLKHRRPVSQLTKIPKKLDCEVCPNERCRGTKDCVQTKEDFYLEDWRNFYDGNITKNLAADICTKINRSKFNSQYQKNIPGSRNIYIAEKILDNSHEKMKDNHSYVSRKSKTDKIFKKLSEETAENITVKTWVDKSTPDKFIGADSHLESFASYIKSDHSKKISDKNYDRKKFIDDPSLKIFSSDKQSDVHKTSNDDTHERIWNEEFDSAIQKMGLSDIDIEKCKFLQGLTPENNYYLNIKELTDALLKTIESAKESQEVSSRHCDCRSRNTERNSTDNENMPEYFSNIIQNEKMDQRPQHSKQVLNKVKDDYHKLSKHEGTQTKEQVQLNKKSDDLLYWFKDELHSDFNFASSIRNASNSSKPVQLTDFYPTKIDHEHHRTNRRRSESIDKKIEIRSSNKITVGTQMSIISKRLNNLKSEYASIHTKENDGNLNTIDQACSCDFDKIETELHEHRNLTEQSEIILDEIDVDSEKLDQKIIESEIKIKTLIENDIDEYSRKQNIKITEKMDEKSEKLSNFQNSKDTEILERVNESLYKTTKPPVAREPECICNDLSPEEYSNKKTFDFIFKKPMSTVKQRNVSTTGNYYDNYRSQFYVSLEKFYNALHKRSKIRAENEKKLYKGCICDN